MAKAPSSQDMVSRFQQGMAGAGAKYTAGVMRVTENPMAAAAAKVDDGTWAANTTAAAGRMSARLKAGSLQSWQQSIQQYGSQRFTSAAQKAAANYAKVAPALASACAAASQAAKGIADPYERCRAAGNAMRAAFGKPAQ